MENVLAFFSYPYNPFAVQLELYFIFDVPIFHSYGEDSFNRTGLFF